MVAPATKGGRRPQAAFILAPQGAHLPSGAILYNYPGRSPQTACKAQPFTGRTLGAQGRKPRRRHQPSRRSRVNLREYGQAPFSPQSLLLQTPPPKGGIYIGAARRPPPQSVSRLKGRPLIGQARGQLRLTCVSHAGYAQSGTI